LLDASAAPGSVSITGMKPADVGMVVVPEEMVVVVVDVDVTVEVDVTPGSVVVLVTYAVLVTVFCILFNDDQSDKAS